MSSRAHERSGGGEIRARRYRDHGRHPNGQRRGERHPGAADAFHLDVGFQERPRAADGDRSGEARYAHTRILRPCDGALLCRSAVSGDPHEPARSDAQRGDLRYAGVAEAALTLTGQRRAAQLSGAIRIRDFHTKVDYTQVGYDVSEALLTVENNRLRMQQVQVADQLGNRGSWISTSICNICRISPIR